MYNSYFNFSGSPFENNLDQRFLFRSDDHQEVLTALLNFIKTQPGFGVVCGEAGTGKTMLIHALMASLPENVTPLLISQPYINSQDILLYLAKILKVKTTGARNVLALTDKITIALTEAREQQKGVLLIIDEAHLLSYQALEEIRLLSNIETTDQKLIHILLVGQYELCHKLDRAEMRHLRQRLNFNRFLANLDSTDTIRYIDHRLQQVGSSFAAVFADNCRRSLFAMTQGAPRLINQLCDQAFLITMAQGRRKVSRKTLREAEEALQTDRIFIPPPPGMEKGRPGKSRNFVKPVVAGLSIALLCLLAVIMAREFLPFSQMFKSVGTSGPPIKSSAKPAEIKPKPAPGPVTPEAKLSTSTPAPGPPPDLKKETSVVAPPPPEVKVAPAPLPAGPPGPPEVKPETPVPHEAAGPQLAATQPEIPATGPSPEGQTKEGTKAPEPPGENVKPEGETPAPAALPAPPVIQKVVTKSGDTLSKIASKQYPKDPDFGIIAIILQNANVTDKNRIRARDVLYLPKIDFEKHTIQLKDNLWYGFYDGFYSQENAKRIAAALNAKEVKFLIRPVKSGAGNASHLIYIGGYATEAELVKALDSVAEKE
jgi:type II secretory pathway predicted ATPase ExeA